jgi:hypothetical protein
MEWMRVVRYGATVYLRSPPFWRPRRNMTYVSTTVRYHAYNK